VFGLGAVGIGIPKQGETVSPGLYVLGFFMYVALSFVTIYFNAAVIGTAMKRLRGEDAKISDGLALARKNIGKIFVWAVLTATVGMILRQLQERAGIIGRIVIGIVGIAWSVLTYFVVPVLLFEPVGVGESIKRSTQIFRERWGEQFIGNATITFAVILIGIPVVLVGALLTVVIPPVGILVLIVSIGALMAIGAACSGVFNAALYRYATTGEASGAFTAEDMNASFRPRRGARGSMPGAFMGGALGGGSTMPAPPSSDEPNRPDL
jgi:hypothetical protein